MISAMNRGFAKLAAAAAVLSSVAVTAPQIALTGGSALVGASILSSAPAEAQSGKRLCGRPYKVKGTPALALAVMEVDKDDRGGCDGYLRGMKTSVVVNELNRRLDSSRPIVASDLELWPKFRMATCEDVTLSFIGNPGRYGGDICNSMEDYTRYVFVTHRS